jgi:TPR repeat protein
MANSSARIPVAVFAQQLKEKNPDSASTPDDKLVEAFLRDNPQYKGNYEGSTLVSVSIEPTGAPSNAQEKSHSSQMPYSGATVVVNSESLPGPPRIGKYEIVNELGSGGMGIVYKAFDPGIGRTVALKVMSQQLARDADFRNRFLREARGAGVLQHPNIVTVHELGEWQGAPFIAMEFLQGDSFECILKNQNTRPLEERLGIIAQVCRGLDYAHARGIVHRDIKPANVIVTAEGVAKIVDFGIARLADQKLTTTGQVLGTVSYMSPEQLQGRALDGRSDIFAAGVMLFEALTSVLPFAAEDTGSAITNILYRQPPKLSVFLANYPAELDDIIAKCLAKDPAERFQSAGELADRIGSVREQIHAEQAAPTMVRSTALPTPPGIGTVPLPPVEPTRTVLSARRIVGAALTALLLLLGVISWRALRMRSPSSATSVNELKKHAESGDAVAQLRLGLAYQNGRGVEHDDTEAVGWLRKSAEQGNPHAQVQLGVAYCKGQGVRQDFSEGLKWYRKAAEQGDALGEVNLGGLYEVGLGVAKDDNEAVGWYLKSAAQGNPHGEFNLASMYLDGKGVPKDDAKGAFWYRKAADQGDSGAQNNLGVLYENGRGVAKDLAEAVRWYRKSAEQGNTHGQENLKRLDRESGEHFGAMGDNTR